MNHLYRSNLPAIFAALVSLILFGAVDMAAQAPAMSTQPESQTVCSGQPATFTAAAAGTPTPAVQWQVSTDGGSNWRKVPGATNPKLSFTAATNQTGYRYRAIFTSDSGTVTSDVASLIVNVPSTITVQPVNDTACAGTEASFRIARAGGVATPTVQWQTSTDGGSSWSDLPGATDTTISFTTADAQNGNLFRALVSNPCGAPVASKPATLSVLTLTVVTAHPTVDTTCAGDSAVFTAAATGNPIPTVQWEVSSDGGTTWTGIAGATNTTLRFIAAAADEGHRYRARFGGCNAPVTESARLTVHSAPTITIHPIGDTICSGSAALVTANAIGNPTPSYTFQTSTDGGSTWTTPFGTICCVSMSELSVKSFGAENGQLYRWIFSNICGTDTTDVATVTLTSKTIVTSHPENATVCIGDKATFAASATASVRPAIRWQRSSDGGGTWADVPGANDTTLTVTATAEDNNSQYRASFINYCGETVTSNPATLSVQIFATVTANPVSDTACTDGSASFTVEYSGTPAPSVQWQTSTDAGKSWSTLPDAGGATLSFTPTAEQNNHRFRAILTNPCGTPDTSTAATLTVHVPTTVTAHPADTTVCAGSRIIFSSAATGSPAPKLQWQTSTDGGGTWSDVAGATGAKLSITALANQNDHRFRALFSNVCGSPVPSAIATLTVLTPTVVMSQPSGDTACTGSDATFEVSFTGNPTPSVQWQTSADGGKSWTNVAGATSTMLTIPSVAVAQNGNRFRATLTNSCGSAVNSGSAALTVHTGTSITANPGDTTVCVGGKVTFAAAATGTPTPTVQWQSSTDGGSTWNNVSGGSGARLSLAATAAENGTRYRALFSNSCGAPVPSSAAALTVNTPPSITSQPASVTTCAGTSASFTVSAAGTPAPSVQWQMSTNGGTAWNNMSGETNPTLTFTSAAAQNNNRYRAVLTNACGAPVNSSAATLTVNTPTSITAGPRDTTLCVGGKVSLAAAATGTPTPTVQWQTSADGGSTWGDVPGATGGRLSFTATASQNGARYRALFSNSCGAPVATSPLTLTLNTATSITTQPTGGTYCEGASVTFNVGFTGNPAPTVQWQSAAAGSSTWNGIAGATGTTYTLTAAAAQSGNRYRALVSNACGAPVPSDAATLTVVRPTTVSTHPASATVVEGGSAKLTAAAAGLPAPKVQWQRSTDGTSWNNVAGATGTTLSVNAKVAESGYRYRAVFTSAAQCGGEPVATNPATVTVTPKPKPAKPKEARSR